MLEDFSAKHSLFILEVTNSGENSILLECGSLQKMESTVPLAYYVLLMDILGSGMVTNNIFQLNLRPLDETFGFGDDLHAD